MARSIYIETYGCQMNEYDSGKIGDLFKQQGYTQVYELNAECDVCLVNTCNIRYNPAHKIHARVEEMARKKAERAKLGLETTIVVAGCVAQAEGDEIVRRSPAVDIVVGPQAYHTLPVLMEELRREQKWVMNLEFTENDKFDQIQIDEDAIASVSSFLSIQEGCDKFCYFCCVPYTRGAEFSRPVNSIYEEASSLVKRGAKELYLLGQNVSAYHGKQGDAEVGLEDLIKQLSQIPNLERIRYTTSHPMDMCREGLFEMHATVPQLMPALHLPAQVGSDKILKAMNRKYTREQYCEIIAKYRRYRPDIAIFSDFIVGYPGETEEDFMDTMDLVERIKYAQAYSFKYSMRPGTPASMIEPQVPEEVKADRLNRLQLLLGQQQSEFNHAMVGSTCRVLLHKHGKKPGQLLGKSPYLQSVIVIAEDTMLNQFVDVKIEGATRNSLFGTIVY